MRVVEWWNLNWVGHKIVKNRSEILWHVDGGRQGSRPRTATLTENVQCKAPTTTTTQESVVLFGHQVS